MCVPKNTSQPANVEIVCRRCTIYAMQQAAIPCVGKGCAFFDKLKKKLWYYLKGKTLENSTYKGTDSHFEEEYIKEVFNR